MLVDEDGVANIIWVLLLLYSPPLPFFTIPAPAAGPQLPDLTVVEPAVWRVEVVGRELWKSDDEDAEEAVDAEDGLWL